MLKRESSPRTAAPAALNVSKRSRRGFLLAAAATTLIAGCSSGLTGLVTSRLSRDGLDARLEVISDSEDAYCARGTLESSGADIESWSLVIDLHQSSLVDFTGATADAHGRQLTVTPLAGQGRISRSSSASFRFCGEKDGSSYAPTLVSLSAVSAPPGGAAGGGDAGSGGGHPGAGGGATGGGTGGANAAGGGAGGSGGGSGGGANPMGGGGGSGGGAGPGLAATPPMGWNSWNTFQCNMDEQLIKQMADTMVSSGMQAVGYQYVNIDDCWMDGRDSSGKLRWNTSKFPSGIPALADYVHQKGLKLGIYETPNTKTCVGLYGNNPAGVGSLGHEATDAQTFASWGVDYLKYDLCLGQRSSFAVMRDALRATGRPIFYSINPGNGENDLCPPSRCALDLPTVANMWRIGFDIGPNWASVIRLIDQNANLASYAGPGHWNDPDMMEVGNGLNDTEGRAHFSMWAIMAAPLIAGNDLRRMSAATRETLTNAEVIAVDQDPLGVQGQLVASPATNLQVWSKRLSGAGSRAVVLFNRGTTSASISVSWSALGLAAGKATVRDLWSHADLGTFTDAYTAAAVPGHGAVMLKITSLP
jgi:alpha-galactosidase